MTKCKPHDIASDLYCTNKLKSGLTCPNSICDHCFEMNAMSLNLLPSRTDIFFFDCIQNIPSGKKCLPHGITCELRCNNTLSSGNQCEELLCKFCFSHSEESRYYLPKMSCHFCYNFIHDLRSHHVKSE